MANYGKFLAIATVALVALATPVSARGVRHGYRGGPFGGPFHGGQLGWPPVRPDRQCLQNCQQTNRLCLGSKRNDGQACAQSTCGTERQAAQDACAADRTSTDCQSALSTFRACLQPCRDAFKAAIHTCLGARWACRTTCASATPPPQPDPQCVAGCRSTLLSCRVAAGTVAQSCNADCGSLITAAEQACAADPRASACSTALQVAFACIQPCGQTRRTTLQGCLETAQGCVASCSLPTPTPTP
jgi:hypothetical protein